MQLVCSRKQEIIKDNKKEGKTWKIDINKGSVCTKYWKPIRFDPFIMFQSSLRYSCDVSTKKVSKTIKSISNTLSLPYKQMKQWMLNVCG